MKRKPEQNPLNNRYSKNSHISLSRTGWDYLQTSRYPTIRDIEVKILKNKWLGLKKN